MMFANFILNLLKNNQNFGIFIVENKQEEPMKNRISAIFLCIAMILSLCSCTFSFEACLLAHYSFQCSGQPHRYTAVKHKKAEINYKTAPKYDVPARGV
jgi:hypothetical protein